MKCKHYFFPCCHEYHWRIPPSTTSRACTNTFLTRTRQRSHRRHCHRRHRHRRVLRRLTAPASHHSNPSTTPASQEPSTRRNCVEPSKNKNSADTAASVSLLTACRNWERSIGMRSTRLIFATLFTWRDFAPTERDVILFTARKREDSIRQLKDRQCPRLNISSSVNSGWNHQAMTVWMDLGEVRKRMTTN